MPQIGHSQPRGDHLRSPGRRLGRTAGELDLLQGRSTLGARLSQGAGAALPRCALNRSPAQIACGDAVVDQPSQEGLIGARTRASAQRPQIRVREPGVTLKVAGVERTSRAGRGSAPRGSAGPIRRFRAARSAARAGADLAIHARCAPVGAALGIRMRQNILTADLVVQGVEAIAGFRLRFRV